MRTKTIGWVGIWSALALHGCAKEDGASNELTPIQAGGPGSDTPPQDPAAPTTTPAGPDFPAELLPDQLVEDLELIAPAAGGEAIFSGIVTLQPGDDVTYCTFLESTTTGVTYIHNTLGTQSRYGHHAILYYTAKPQAPGTRACGSMESMRQILGGTGGEGAAMLGLASNVVSEVPAGAQFVLNHHWINHGEQEASVQAMIVTQPPDSTEDLVIARSMAIVSTGWKLPPGQVSEHTGECELQADVPAIAILGHEHEWGTWVTAERIQPDGAAEMLFDHAYTAEMTSNPKVVNYPVDSPLMLRAGDRIRMTCEWMNDTPETIEFPREMCVFFANTLAEDDVTCVNGRWR